MSGLSPAEKLAMGLVENTPAWQQMDHAIIAAHAKGLLDRFGGVSADNLARVLLTTALGLETMLGTSDDPEMQAVAAKAFCVELQMLAAAMTRKQRGLPPLGVNGSGSKKVEETGAGEE